MTDEKDLRIIRYIVIISNCVKKKKLTYFSDRFTMAQTFGTGMLLMRLAIVSEYAPIFSNIIQSPMFKSGNFILVATRSLLLHTGPQIEHGIESPELET